MQSYNFTPGTLEIFARKLIDHKMLLKSSKVKLSSNL